VSQELAEEGEVGVFAGEGEDLPSVFRGSKRLRNSVYENPGLGGARGRNWDGRSGQGLDVGDSRREQRNSVKYFVVLDWKETLHRKWGVKREKGALAGEDKKRINRADMGKLSRTALKKEPSSYLGGGGGWGGGGGGWWGGGGGGGLVGGGGVGSPEALATTNSGPNTTNEKTTPPVYHSAGSQSLRFASPG